MVEIQAALEKLNSRLRANNGVVITPHPNAKLFKKESELITDHFAGDRLPSCIQDAFPREDKEALKYREKSWLGETSEPVERAMRGITQVTSSAKFAITVESPKFSDWLENKRIEGERVEQWILNQAYKYRVIDPNGFLFIKPFLIDGGMDCSIEYIASYQVYYIPSMPDVFIYKQNPTDRNFKIITEGLYGDLVMVEKFWTVTNPFNFGYDRENVNLKPQLPLVVLGSQKRIRVDDNVRTEVYKSDFAHAVPPLNNLAIKLSQKNATLLNYAFPTRTATGDICRECNGHGTLQIDAENTTECKTCKGRGITMPTFSVFDTILATKPFDAIDPELRLKSLEIAPIRTDYPPIELFTLWANEVKDAREIVDRALSIGQATNFAQSAVAKQFDEQNKYIDILAITNDLFQRIIVNVLKIAQDLLLETGNISITVPTSFSSLSESDVNDLWAELFKVPEIMRQRRASDIIQKAYPDEPLLKRGMQLSYEYAPFVLLSADERIKSVGAGVSNIEVIKAIEVQRVLTKLVISGELANLTDEQFFALVDKEVNGATINIQDVLNAANNG